MVPDSNKNNDTIEARHYKSKYNINTNYYFLVIILCIIDIYSQD
jgi:hypothetical protein